MGRQTRLALGVKSSPEPLSPIGGVPSLRELAYKTIKEAILTLRLPPGTPLVEAQLAGQLRISKTPVRDALQLLEHEGLVKITPYKGATVSEISLRDVQEIFQLREILEPAVVRLATPLLTREDQAEAERLLQQAQQALRTKRYEEYLTCNTKLHGLFFQRLGNRRMTELYYNLDEQIKRIRRVSVSLPSSPERMHQQHSGIWAAVRKGDGTRAAELTREHIHGFLQEVLAHAAQQGLQEPGAAARGDK
ncbi:MAG: GntR family transcriptional regulator [Deinococcus sp.]|nr:GntR family transcriptional regulator [Deinococcus sp.]